MLGTTEWTYAESGGVMLIHHTNTENLLSAKPGGTCTLKTPRRLTDEEVAAIAAAVDAFIRARDSEVSGDADGA